jgi:hypothetical protein
MEGSQLCSGAQLSPIDIDQTETAAACEDLLISFGERDVSSPVRNHQNLQQGQARRDRRKTPLVNRHEDPIKHSQKMRVLFDEVDKDYGIERQRAIANFPD